jgi:hypothetical protein
MWNQHKHALSYKLVQDLHQIRGITEAIKAMKRGKAAGVNNIPTEILQVDPHLRAEMLYPLFLDIWKEERYSKD